MWLWVGLATVKPRRPARAIQRSCGGGYPWLFAKLIWKHGVWFKFTSLKKCGRLSRKKSHFLVPMDHHSRCFDVATVSKDSARDLEQNERRGRGIIESCFPSLRTPLPRQQVFLARTFEVGVCVLWIVLLEAQVLQSVWPNVKAEH